MHLGSITSRAQQYQDLKASWWDVQMAHNKHMWFLFCYKDSAH